MSDLVFAALFLLAALSGFIIGAIWQQLVVIRLRAERNNWERQARQLAARFEPMPAMHFELRDGVPVLTPDGYSWDDCEEITQEEIEIG